MEIGPLTSSLSVFPAAGEARAPSRGEVRPPEAATAEARRTAVEQARAERERQEALRASRESLRDQAMQTASGGSIEFEQDDGTRVMKVLDSKDVLIYQVPPKGQLTLVRAEEAAAGRDPISA